MIVLMLLQVLEHSSDTKSVKVWTKKREESSDSNVTAAETVQFNPYLHVFKVVAVNEVAQEVVANNVVVQEVVVNNLSAESVRVLHHLLLPKAGKSAHTIKRKI